MKELIEELEKKKENQEVVVIDWVLDKLRGINVYYEVAKSEVECAIEDVCNDYVDFTDKGEELYNDEEEIRAMAWKLSDYDVWGDVYDMAREMVLDKLRGFENDN